jgi:FtsH-binding integral membrane protein
MNRPYFPAQAPAAPGLAYDAGLRRHMLGIYNNMALGLVITGLVAFGIAGTPALYQPIFGTPLKWAAMFAPLAFVFFLSFRIERMSLASARTAFFAFAAVMGVSMAAVFLSFTGASIARTFFIAASMFLGMSLWGYTTKRDLTGWSSFLLMGLIGVVVASIVNVFLGSTTLQLIVSFAGIIVFTGLTAWDTQRAKSDYLAFAGTAHAEKLGIMGALSLYLNFVNLFQLLLTFFGQREE